MKRLIIILTIGLVLVLAACAPVPPAGQEENVPDTPVEATTPPEFEPDSPDGPDDQASEGEEPPLNDTEKRQLPWDTSPETLIISATFCCGFAPQLAVTNYVPDAQVWGDGRVVWVETQDDGSRRVLEGSIDLGQLELLLVQFREEGFYKWDEYYSNPQVADAAEQCIQVNVLEGEKSVCEYYEGAPEAFHDLYALLITGAGATNGVDYVPETGFLTTIPLGSDIQAGTVDEVLSWNSAELGVSLNSVGEEGLWITGEALESSWAVVNQRPWNPLVREGDSYFMLGLQVPELSMVPPP